MRCKLPVLEGQLEKVAAGSRESTGGAFILAVVALSPRPSTASTRPLQPLPEQETTLGLSLRRDSQAGFSWIFPACHLSPLLLKLIPIHSPGTQISYQTLTNVCVSATLFTGLTVIPRMVPKIRFIRFPSQSCFLLLKQVKRSFQWLKNTPVLS